MKLQDRFKATWKKMRQRLRGSSYRDEGESQRMITWGVLVVALLVAAGVLMGIANGSQQGVALLFPLIGTFLGAALAFATNVSQERTKRKREARESLHRAAYVLIVQRNEIGNYIKQWDGYSHIGEMAFNFPAFQPSDKFEFRQNLDSLAFLLRANVAGPNLLFKLTVEQQRFDMCIQAIRQRNDLYVNQVQPIIEKHFKNGDSVKADALKEAFGTRIFDSAINSMQNILVHLVRSDQSISAMHALCVTEGNNLFGPSLRLAQYIDLEPRKLPDWIKEIADRGINPKDASTSSASSVKDE